MQSFYIATFPELLNNPDMKEVKAMIKNKTGIKEEDQRYQITFNYYGDGSNFFDNAKLKIYDNSKYRAKLVRHSYFQDFILELHEGAGTNQQVSQKIFEQTNVPIERLKFISDEFDSSYYHTEENYDVNSFRDKISLIKITKELNDIINIKYPNSEIKEIKTDLFNTGLELLEELQNNKIQQSSDIKYLLVHNNKNLFLEDLLINQGIKNGDLIEINNTGMIHFSIKNLTGKTIKIETPPNISVKLLKYFILIKEGYPISEQRLVFDGKQLENSKSIAEYGIQNESTLTLVLSLRG